VAVHRHHIVLIGFSGSGKTTVAKHLAKRLRIKLIDIDSEIEREFKSDISSIFKKHGEKRFRQIEHTAIRRVFANKRKPAVISMGGGAFVSRRNRQLIKQSSLTVWLSCSVREIYRRLKSDNSRPLLVVKATRGDSKRETSLRRIFALLSKRVATYALADIRVSTTNRSSKAAATEIVRRLRRLYASD